MARRCVAEGVRRARTTRFQASLLCLDLYFGGLHEEKGGSAYKADEYREDGKGAVFHFLRTARVGEAVRDDE